MVWGWALVHLGRDHVEGDQDLDLVLRREPAHEALDAHAFHWLVAPQKETKQQRKRQSEKGHQHG
jgi:hypothetical protein